MNFPQFDNYEIIREIGKGGMATVYLAKDLSLDKRVAIKVLDKQFVYNSKIKDRFIGEAKKMANINHPNIVQVTQLINTPDQVALIMEYVEGFSLKEVLEQRKLSDTEIENYFSQMVKTVEYIHSKSIIHRDIKPSNFLIDKQGAVKLSDFGIAKDTTGELDVHTSTTNDAIIGTPMYMSPEQVEGLKGLTTATDIYSLGIVLWEMASGRTPYDMSKTSRFRVMNKIVNEQLEKIGTKWDSLIQSMTNKNPNRRINIIELGSLIISQPTIIIEPDTNRDINIENDKKNRKHNNWNLFNIVMGIILILFFFIGNLNDDLIFISYRFDSRVLYEIETFIEIATGVIFAAIIFYLIFYFIIFGILLLLRKNRNKTDTSLPPIENSDFIAIFGGLSIVFSVNLPIVSVLLVFFTLSLGRKANEVYEKNPKKYSNISLNKVKYGIRMSIAGALISILMLLAVIYGYLA